MLIHSPEPKPPSVTCAPLPATPAPQKPSQDIASCASRCEFPTEHFQAQQDLGLPCQEHIRTSTPQLLRQFGVHFHSQLSPWGWAAKAELGERDCPEKGKKEGADEASQVTSPTSSFPWNSAQERIIFLLH